MQPSQIDHNCEFPSSHKIFNTRVSILREQKKNSGVKNGKSKSLSENGSRALTCKHLVLVARDTDITYLSDSQIGPNI